MKGDIAVPADAKISTPKITRVIIRGINTNFLRFAMNLRNSLKKDIVRLKTGCVTIADRGFDKCETKRMNVWF